MRMQVAMDIIAKGRKKSGYLVHFEKVEGQILASGYFPERDEAPIATEAEAWTLAWRFAAATVGDYVNLYVVYAIDFTPVEGYDRNKIPNRGDVVERLLPDGPG